MRAQHTYCIAYTRSTIAQKCFDGMKFVRDYTVPIMLSSGKDILLNISFVIRRENANICMGGGGEGGGFQSRLES